MNYLADKSYIAIKPQVAAETPVIPDNFAPLISESIRLNPNYAADRRMKGIDWKSDDLLKGLRNVAGDISVHGDPDIVGHILNMVYAKGVTAGNAASGYTHPFTVGDGKNYTVEIPRGAYAQRIWGVRGDGLRMEFVDNKLVLVLSIKALGQFNGASLAAALTGPGMTTCVLSTDYDLNPTKGLLADDVIVIGSKEIKVVSLDADGKTINFGATTVTALKGAPVYLKAQTPTFGTIAEPFYMGNVLVGIGVDETAATTAAGAKATATPCYNFAMNFKNNLLDQPASGSMGPSVLLNQVKEGGIELSRLFENPQQYQKWIENIKQALTSIFTGRFINTALTISEAMTMKFYKVKIMDNDQPLETGAYIFDKQNLEILYDTDVDAALDIELVNKTTGVEYGDSEES